MRRIELVSGGAATVVGLLGLAAVMISIGLRVPLDAAPYLLSLVLALCGIGIGAYLHAEHGLSEGRVILWISVVLVGVGMVIAAASFGLVLLPAMLLGLAAAAAAKIASLR